jgi:alpha-beta hydrolase superfamily lysophospholipase
MKRTLSRPLFVRVAVTAGLLLALITGGCAALQHEERELTFRPAREAASWYAGLPAGVEEVTVPIPAGDGGDHIDAWWWPAEDASAPAVLYLHGARWNLTGQVYRLRQLRDFGFSVFAIDYRGFGRSAGELPSEETVYQDARAAWNWLAQRQPDRARRFIYGHSLGGAVAIDLAASLEPSQPAAGLIIESTFTSLADIAAELSSRWLPFSLLLSQKFDSIDKMTKVSAPVLIVHGEGDRYVPYRFSQALFDAAKAPKKLLLVEGGSHNNSMFTGEEQYREALSELFGLHTSDEPVVPAAAPSRLSRSHRKLSAGDRAPAHKS